MVKDSSLKTVSDELMTVGDIMACAVINQRGELLGVNYGQVPVDDELKKYFSQMAGTIWGGLNRASSFAGPLTMVSAVFQNFKIIGLPIEGTNIALLLTVDVKLDSYILRDRVLDFMKYWLRANGYVK